MRHYEVTFIVDPVLSGDELKSTAQAYADMIQSEDCTIVHVDEMGLRPLAYPIKKRYSGVYYCIEFAGESSSLIDRLELALRRDERIMRFLTVALDKFGVKYNDDKRNGLIGKSKKVKPADGEAAPVAPVIPKDKPSEPLVAPVAAAAAAPLAASIEAENVDVAIMSEEE
jgi:small subunit ribosomal protein S6